MGKKSKTGNKPMASGTELDASNQQDPSMIENEEPTNTEGSNGTTEGAVTENTGVASTEIATENADAPPATDAVTEAPADAPAEAPSYQQSDIDAGILSGFKHRLEEYCQAMGRSVPVSPARGSQHQHNLYRLFLDILRQDGNLFTKAWSDLLAGVYEQRNGCFDPLYANRFVNEIKALGKTELRVFQNLMHLACITADRKSRAQMLKTVDFTSVTANVPVPGAFEKLHGFYFSA